MSTSSGRGTEACDSCGHALEGHAKLRHTKCKKCKKSFEVCQAGIHGNNGVGWRICFVPCSCGEKYFPLGLNKSHELAGHEYLPDHPSYRPLPPEIDDETIGAFANISIGRSGHRRDKSKNSVDEPWSKWSWQEENNRYYRSCHGNSGLSYEYDYDTPKPSGWSDWTWDGNKTRYYRSRVTEEGETIYEYDVTTAPPDIKGKQKEKEKEWSKWSWQEEHKRYYRWCYGESGEVEYDFDYKSPQPSGWNDWIWDGKKRYYYRSRIIEEGETIYEYDVTTASPDTKGKRKNKR